MSKKKLSRSHFDFENIETFIRYGIYPSSISSKDFGSKSNCRGADKKFSLKEGSLIMGRNW